jgi:hypothetical protein
MILAPAARAAATSNVIAIFPKRISSDSSKKYKMQSFVKFYQLKNN